MENLITMLLIFPGVFAPFMVTFALLRIRKTIPQCMFIASIVSLLTFIFCIAVPFYFQGYSRLESAAPSTALGWTALPIMGSFAYLYTFELLGFIWLFAGIIQAVLGEVSARRVEDGLAKAAVVLAYSLLLFEFHKYHATINIVLE